MNYKNLIPIIPMLMLFYLLQYHGVDEGYLIAYAIGIFALVSLFISRFDNTTDYIIWMISLIFIALQI